MGVKPLRKVLCFAIAKQRAASAERWRLWRAASCNLFSLSVRFISAVSRSVSEVVDRIEVVRSWLASASSREARPAEFLVLSVHPMTSSSITRKGHVLSSSGRSLQMSGTVLEMRGRPLDQGMGLRRLNGDARMETLSVMCPKLEALHRVAVARDEERGVDGCTSDAEVKGEAADGDCLVGGEGWGGAAGPVGALEEVEVGDEGDILREARTGAGRAAVSRGHVEPGERGDVFRAQVCEGAGGAHVNTGDADRAQCSEVAVVRLMKALLSRYTTQKVLQCCYVSPRVL